MNATTARRITVGFTFYRLEATAFHLVDQETGENTHLPRRFATRPLAEQAAATLNDAAEKYIDFALQAYNETRGAWETVGHDRNADMAAIRDQWRNAAQDTGAYVRVLLVGAPADANVVFGSASDNPVQAAADHAALPY